MGAKKRYGSSEEYVQKLKRVMDRLGVSEYRYDWNRTEPYVEFCHKGSGIWSVRHTCWKKAERNS